MLPPDAFLCRRLAVAAVAASAVPQAFVPRFQHHGQHPARGVPRASANSTNGAYNEMDDIWDRGSPQYMQDSQVCSAWEETLRQSAKGKGTAAQDNVVWRTVRREAQEAAAAEPLLSSFLYASILSHDTMERSVAFVLANRLMDATLLATELFEVFHSILRNNPAIAQAVLADICAVRERDPACGTYMQALLYFKGFQAIQVHRIAHELWVRGRRMMAVALQSRMSEVFAVDIHPAAVFGSGILLDHGTGVVVGQTARIGNNVSILQNVTLGGTGKDLGDRHPKISDNVLIGAGAAILGNITVGKGAQVAAGSLVLKPVPPRTMVAGSPAREVGLVTGNPAQKMEQSFDSVGLLQRNLAMDPFAQPPSPPAASPAAATEPGAAAAVAGMAYEAADGEAAAAGQRPNPDVAAALAAAAAGGGSVQAVSTDEEAALLWPEEEAELPEYFI